MSNPVHVIGACRTDFKRNLLKEGRGLRDIIAEAARGAVADAGIAPRDVQSGVVGNFAAGLFTRQLHLGALLAEADPAWRGLPTLHAEAACASGAVAVLTGAHQIMAGLRDVVLVVGAEQQKTMAPADGADVLGAAADFKREKAAYGDFMIPKLFGRIAQLYQQKFGLTDEQLAAVALKNYEHARRNPLAQTRDAAPPAGEANTRIAPPLRLSDCSQITDGAAAVVLCSKRFADKLTTKSAARLTGFGHRTDHLALDAKDAPHFSVARAAAADAYAMAGTGPQEISAAEVHDCFSITEIVAYEILRFAEPGQGARLAESGATRLGSRLPVNAGGGLIGDGHPVGATGVRQVCEAFLQLTGRAGERQVAGAKRYLCLNIGGSLTTTVVTIWES